MVTRRGWIVGAARRQPDLSVDAEILAIRCDLDDPTSLATARGEALKVRVKELIASQAREVLLGSVLRLLPQFETETVERVRALGRCTP